jgi:hypothetical protein
VEGLTDEQLEALNSDVDEGGDSSDPVAYMHVRDVEARIESNPELVKKAGSEFDVDHCETDTERWNAEFDQLREGWHTGSLSF